MEPINIIIPILASAGYSAIWFFKSVIDPEKPTTLKDFEIPRFLATVFLGIVIGGIGVLSGVEVTQIGIETSLLAYAFVIAGVQQVGTAIYSLIKEKFGE